MKSPRLWLAVPRAPSSLSSLSRVTGARALTAVAFGLLAATLGVFPALAQSAEASDLWSDLPTKSLLTPADLIHMPTKFRTLELDGTRLESRLAGLASDRDAGDVATVEIELPLPDGGTARFLVYAASVMAPELAAKYPQIQSYAGRGIDDPTATVRFDWTEHGFNAIILGAQRSVLIAPRNQGDRVRHLSYDFKDVPAYPWVEPEIVIPGLEEEEAEHAHHAGTEHAGTEYAGTKTATTTSGSQLRIFRMAVTASGDYTQVNGGTVASALAAINTRINQLNAIWEREAAVRFVLVAENETLIFTDPGTDPFVDECGTNELNQAQTTVDTLLGSAKYDIHHLFLRNYCGGVVGGAMCIDGQKGRGQTGVGIPIDILAHEIGHQFTMSHTWSRCGGTTGSQYRGDSAYEPGSGDSIMSYAGICGVDNLDTARDLEYHVRSLDQKTSHLASQLSCGSTFPLPNTAPVPNGGSTLFTFPRSTPFVLEGSATDAEGDVMTFSWEQFDLPDAEPPSDAGSAPNNGEPPFFRRFPEVSEPSRTFPQISDVINGTTTLGEELPDHARTLTLRLIAKDNASGGGGVAYDEISMNIDGTAGPFAVTSPNAGTEIWAHGASETVTWNVASTDLAPIRCSSVNIDLSTDGGNTFPISLAAGTANDGSESITVPVVTHSAARVRVRCAQQRNTADTVDVTDHFFFDMSDADFRLVQTVPGPCVTSLEVGNLADDGACSLRETVKQAPAGSKITFHPDLNGGDIQLTTGEILIDKALTLDGDGIDITVSAGDAARIFRAEAAGTVAINLEGFTLRDGVEAFFNCGESVTLRRMRFESNSGASFGSALAQNCGNGYTIWDSTFEGNSTGNRGPALYLVNGTTTIHRSTFSGNTASASGGAIYVQGGTLNLNNSTLTGNSSGSAGSGITVGVGGTLVVNNSTLAGNTTGNTAGGNLFNEGSLTLRNAILADALGGSPDCGSTGTIAENVNTLVEDGSCNTGTVLSGFATGDPSLGALADNGGRTQTMALLPGSSAIDSGDNSVCQGADVGDVDQRGYTRSDATCDRGAYEANGTPPPPNRAPYAFDASLSVLDSAADGTVVGDVLAFDVDSDVIAFSIIGQTSVPAGAPAGVFAIDPATGRVTVANATELAGRTRFTLTVQVLDDGLPPLATTATATIAVSTCVTSTVVKSLADSGACTLRDSIAAAAAGATITFDPAIHGQTILLTSGQILLDKALTIDGDGSNVSVSGGDAQRIFEANAPGTVAITLEGFTLRDGAISGGQGGAFHNCGETVVFRRMNIESNSISSFGALGQNCRNGYTIWDSTFKDNSTGNRGAALYLVNGTTTIHRSTFVGNSSPSGGGAVYVQGGTLVMNNSTVTGNSSGNRAGSGLRTGAGAGALILNNVTVAGNTTSSGAGGNLWHGGGSLTLRNSILADALGGSPDCGFDGAAIFAENTNTLVEDGSCNAGLVLTGFLSGDPGLAALADNGGDTQTLAISGGLAKDSGDNPICEGADVGDVDQRGYTRSDATCDRGAYEDGGIAPGGAITPVIAPGQVFAASDASGSGASVGTVRLEAGGTVTFSIVSGNTGNAFAINGATGEITVATPGALDASTTPSYTLLIQAQDTTAPHPFDQEPVANRRWHPPTAPSITTGQVFAVDDAAAIGGVVGTVALDQPTVATFSLIGGNTDNAFAIHPATGQLTVQRTAPLDPAVNAQFQLTVSVLDSNAPPQGDIEVVTVNVNDINRAPAAEDTSLLIASTVASGTFIGSVSASDPDPSDSLSFSITAGNTGSAFSIDPTSGNLFVADPSGFGALPAFSLTVRAADNGSPSLNDTATVGITVSACPTPGVVTSTADSGACTLRQAVLDAAAGDTLTFGSAIHGQTILLTSGEILIDKDLTIDGDGSSVSVSGGDVQRIFRGESPSSTVTITLEGFTLRDGNQPGGQGGAFHNCSETVIFRRMNIESNTGSSFGALGQNCGNGYTIWDSTFKDNSTSNRGAALYLVNGTSTIHRSTFVGNSSPAGGGAVYVQGGTLVVNNSTVTGNTSGGSAGSGLRNSGGTLILNNVTVAGNTTSSGAGGNLWHGAGNLTLRNTIIADALGGSPDCGFDVAASISENTSTLVEDGSCNAGTLLSGFLSGDPGLGVLADNGGDTETMAISGGLAKDSGDNPICEGADVGDTDQRGYIRSDVTCDRGAYEDGGTVAMAATRRTWDGGGTTDHWSEAANWVGDVVPTALDAVVFDATSSKDAGVDGTFGGSVASLTMASGFTGTVRLGRSLAVTGDLAVAAGGTLDLDGETLSVEGSVSNSGTVRDTRAATVVSTAVAIGRIQNAAASTVKYQGVDITPTASSLGNVRVEISGGTSCGNPSDGAIQRCFDVTPDNPVAANLRLYYGVGELDGERAS
ncbi:MAG: cadherin domain-containing protein, partial [Acidobacteriota bacterium]